MSHYLAVLPKRDSTHEIKLQNLSASFRTAYSQQAKLQPCFGARAGTTSYEWWKSVCCTNHHDTIADNLRSSVAPSGSASMTIRKPTWTLRLKRSLILSRRNRVGSLRLDAKPFFHFWHPGGGTEDQRWCCPILMNACTRFCKTWT